ncbi:hypothetical protein ASPWEDRAFT_144037 [Aspergillus wentii DTO 134E9]|uniref:Carboxylic ester hydrolase n=1 Tax=Aspergillus wentii DTO 134E9 TaxID=1073089 RepID=A0A1L9R4X3_ASPWE|nr:uncharacterized protein ASPWEDRAFT_144037 [Aspergillus wentii DTO 134E9]KAI9927242.1 hypothetical protein MW887_003628 [Aspergillus wentii]OJJ29969.1 hypothetical protein ASPWEDRAFT_144037 [Aspergillus wentii DTO 134E9]
MKSSIFALLAAGAAASNLQIDTSSGFVQGGVNSSYPNVRHFLGIPFAKPPVDNLRWLPPQPVEHHDSLINGTVMPPACPQSSGANTPFGIYSPDTLIAGGTSEDCLKLSIWAPNNGKKDLPVIIWFYGGEWLLSGTDIPAWIPAPWIERSQEHIVVSIQYRVNMFGFPGSGALKDQNLGILDQRAGIEWVHKNIARFGGNPDQMILWGQSAGAGSSDILNFAYPDDPIVQGFAQDSGSVFLTIEDRTDDVSNFTSVATHFGCSGSAEHELACLRAIPAANITAYLSTTAGKKLTFKPFIDDKVVFNNYTERYLSNKVSNKPALFGSNLDEGTIFASGVNNAKAKETTYSKFQCPVPYSTAHRDALGLTTYRYQYRGNFTNSSPKSGLGAFHSSELPLIFGTSGQFYGPDTAFEKSVSEKMQDLWVAFAKDPQNGLQEMGWPKSTSDRFLMLGGQDVVNQTVVSAVMDDHLIDGACKSYYSSYLA